MKFMVRHNQYKGRRASGGRASGGRGRGHASAQSSILTLLYFPALFLFLELALHLYMGMQMQYFPIIFFFSMAAGALFCTFTMPFRRRANHAICTILTFVLCLIYIIEMMCKKILQTYYQLFSAADTAMNNKLTDYIDVIISAIGQNALMILFMLLPAILVAVFGRRLLLLGQRDMRQVGLVLCIAVAFHIFALLSLQLPWKGDLVPKQLYRVDTNAEDQVEQLGLWTMLRLDVKHAIVPASNDIGDDFTGIGNLGDNSSVGSSGSTPDGSNGDTSVVTPPPIDTSPNVMDVDLAKIAAEASNDNVKWLAQYFDSVAPTKKNEYTGMFEGYNVIFFTLEGFSGYAIDPVLTPTLYKMVHEGFQFNNFYTPLHFTSTSGGECRNLMGLYPKNGFPTSMKETGVLGTNVYFGLAQQLGKLGYQTLGYHANGDMYGRQASHTNLGYVWKQYKTGLELEMKTDGSTFAWPQSDEYMIRASVDDYINSDDPFHVYYLTISGHTPYTYNRVAVKYKDLVETLPYSETTKAYMAIAIEVDRAFETLINKLDEAGKLENTLIVAAPDHIPYFNADTLEELSGETFGSSADLEALKESAINFDVYKSSLIIWSASMEEPVVVDKVCAQVDILPTVSNLLGLEFDSRMLSGTDVLSDSDPVVIFTSRCWKTDKGFYNRYDQTFTPAEGVTMTAEEQETYVETMKKLVGYRLGCTEKILACDFYDYVFGNKYSPS